MVFQNLEIAFKVIIWSVLQKWDEYNKNGGLTDCLRAFLVSVVFYSNRILCTLSFFSSPILALKRADLKNNNGFRFDIPKVGIEIDVNLPTKTFNFTPFWSFNLDPVEADIKNNGRFGFRILKNTEINVWNVRLSHFSDYSSKSWIRYPECQNTKCQNPECQNPKCQNPECQNPECQYPKRPNPE